jgi:hypothetical protein
VGAGMIVGRGAVGIGSDRVGTVRAGVSPGVQAVNTSRAMNVKT